MQNKQILIIEDEATINRMIKSYFEKAGYTVFAAKDGLSGLDIFSNEAIDLVCLDILMPNMNGWEVAYHIRKKSNVPIIMMSALSEEEDILKGYSLKVDDYITKPFNVKILVAKANNIISRIHDRNHFYAEDVIKTNHITIDLNKHKVFIAETEAILSKTEFDMLVYLVKNEGRICSRNLLLDEIWGIDVYVEDRIVDTYIKRLRKRLGPYAYFIKTVFGVGYRFEATD